MSENYGDTAQAAGSQSPGDQSRQLPAGNFVGREAEQTRFREMLAEMAGGRKGLLGGLLGGSRQGKVSQPVQSRVILVGGPPGCGKTRLSLRLRDIAQKEKDFSGRFRTTRLDWLEVSERDARLDSVLPGQPLPLDGLLDIFQSHCQRDNGGGYFEPYTLAVEETRTLARSVTGEELTAVWEYRARAIGHSLADWSNERPLLFFMENFQLVLPAFAALFRPVMEESGPRVGFILTGEQLPPGLEELVAAERRAIFVPGPLNETEQRRFYELEMSRYDVSAPDDDNARSIELPYRSTEALARLQKVTGGFPLPSRMAAFLLQTGLPSPEMPVCTDGEPAQAAALVETLIAGPLGPGHPDRLKLYALATLRRPEQGLLTAAFDTRKDMLPLEEVLDRLNSRYSFLFEPGRSMSLHPAVLPPLQGWLLDPVNRYDNNGLARVTERAFDYLDARLDEWSANFPTLPARVGDLKWREWALDKAWYAFWRGEENGWPEALALFIAGMGLRPALARQVVALLAKLDRLGALNQTGQRRLELFRQAGQDPAPAQAALRELRVMGQEGGYFKAALPAFTAELNAIMDGLIK